MGRLEVAAFEPVKVNKNELLTKPNVHDNNTNYTKFQLSLFNKLLEYSISSISKLKLAIIIFENTHKATNNNFFFTTLERKITILPFWRLNRFLPLIIISKPKTQA